jgi:hypothetical protein
MKVPLVGLEGVSVTTNSTNNLQQVEKNSAAKSGAVLTQTTFSDQRLSELVAAWPRLPEPIRAGIVAMVKASAPVDKTSKRKDAQ